MKLIAMCYRPELPEGSATLLPCLNCLHSFTNRDFDFSPGGMKRSIIRATIEANLDTLRAVCLTGIIWEQLPPFSRFAHLHELELMAMYDYNGLGELISCCTLLRSFALIPAEQDLIPILRDHPQALPNLNAFKLRAIDYGGNDIVTLAKFLRPKRRLRLLDVTVRTNPRWRGSDPRVSPMLLPLLQIMPDLQDLRVVGLSFHVGTVQRDHTVYMEKYLPRNLTALLFWPEISESSPSVVPAKHWTDLVSVCARAYPSLSFVYLLLTPTGYGLLVWCAVRRLQVAPVPPHSPGLLRRAEPSGGHLQLPAAKPRAIRLWFADASDRARPRYRAGYRPPALAVPEGALPHRWGFRERGLGVAAAAPRL